MGEEERNYITTCTCSSSSGLQLYKSTT